MNEDHLILADPPDKQILLQVHQPLANIAFLSDLMKCSPDQEKLDVMDILNGTIRRRAGVQQADHQMSPLESLLRMLRLFLLRLADQKLKIPKSQEANPSRMP